MPSQISSTLPSFSIIITCYNIERYISQTLLSALNQDYEGELQWVIVDDCSTDSTVMTIESTLSEFGKGKDVCLVRNAVNLGTAGSMDKGIALAKYDWLIWVDHDDIQLPNRCSLTAKAIKDNPKSILMTFARQCIDSEGNYFHEPYSYGNCPYSRAPLYLNLTESIDRCRNFTDLGYSPSINSYGCSLSMNKQLFRQWGGLHEGTSKKLRCLQDSPWELRAALGGVITGVNEIVCLYRTHASNQYNRECTYDYKGYKDLELFWQKNQKMEMATIEQMELDMARLNDSPNLTDWTSEELEQARIYLSKRRAACELRSDWWSSNIVARFFKALRLHKKLPLHMQCWPWPRLLPLSIFAAIRYWMKEKC